MEIDLLWLLILAAVVYALGKRNGTRPTCGMNRNGPPPTDRPKPRPSPPPPPKRKEYVE